MTAYLGLHAELYDVFYADKPYPEEAAFIHEVLRKFEIGKSHRMLELACGTGTHALLFGKLGYDVVAIDDSQDMLDVATHKASLQGSKVKFSRQNMCSLPIHTEPFDVAVCLFDSLGYVRTNESIRQVLEGVHRNLRRDGLFLFEFWHGSAMLKAYDPVRVRRWDLPDGKLLRISETRIMYDQQLAEVSYDIYRLHENGTYVRVQETQANRYFLVQEMKILLHTADFIPLKFFAGFTFEERIDKDVWHVLALARKGSGGVGSG